MAENNNSGKPEVKAKLSTEPYKGVRDFYPEDMALLEYIFSVWKKSAESFGYVEYGASILEPTELYHAKSGEEIINEQTYSFIDRGDRPVTLRPEMTPTVARMVSARRRELSFPIRWYSIPNLFRYERPQRGRLREHFQLNCDIFGLSSRDADVEIIALAHTIMKNFGAKQGDFEIRLNSRILLTKAFEKAGFDAAQSHAMQKLLDRKDKIAPEKFAGEVEKIAGKAFNLSIAPDEEIGAVIKALNDRGISNVVFDETLVRGFDYYTGTVFEVYDTHADNRRALFGGGRYDNLTDLFDGQGAVQPIPAVGFGMGDVTARDFLEIRGLMPTYKNPAHIALLIADETGRAYAESTAVSLRAKNINTVIDYSEKKIGDKIKKANKENINFIAVCGEEETKTNILKVKNLKTGEEVALDSTDAILDFINR